MKNKTKVLTVGTMPDGREYSTEDLQDIATAYNELNYSAPWTLGHSPKAGDPAVGWVRSLEVEGDALVAVSEFNETGAELLEKKLYENKSVSLYTPESPYNPTPGVYSLRHIALLGAEPPASKVLGSVLDYAEGDIEGGSYVSYACNCDVIKNSCGAVVINSTIGFQILYYNIPIKVMGKAIYDQKGLTHQGCLDSFWENPQPVSKKLFNQFKNYFKLNEKNDI